jgi:hypothetical protein
VTRRAAALLALLAVLLGGCGEEAEVRVVTRVFPDGGLQRTLRVEARDPGREEPYPADWLRTGPGILLARPEAWDHVETSATSLRAEGFFAPGEEVPPMLGHSGLEGEVKPDRGDVVVGRQDLVVLDRTTFRETLGDPYGAREIGSALDALLDAVAKRLTAALRGQFGPEIATRSAEAFLRKGARAALLDVFTALRETEAPGKRDARPVRLQQVHAKHQLPVASDDVDQALQADLEALTGRLAAELARANPRLDPAALHAFVAGDQGAVAKILEEPEVGALVEQMQLAFFGAYGLGVRMRFVSRVTLPGRVLRTNGAWDGDAVVFVWDQDDLSAGDVVLQAESIEPNVETLTRVGARRDLDAETLLRLVDLLVRPDLAEGLRAALRKAVENGGLRPLREGLAGDGLSRAGAEVAELLDPEVDR